MPLIRRVGFVVAADAAQRKDLPALRTLVSKKVNVNAPQADGTTALHWAAHYNDTETVKLLLRAGANPAVTNRFGASPLSGRSAGLMAIRAACPTPMSIAMCRWATWAAGLTIAFLSSTWAFHPQT